MALADEERCATCGSGDPRQRTRQGEECGDAYHAVTWDDETRCAEDGCGHPRYEHNGRGGRCTNGRQWDTAAWRCDCREFVEPQPADR